jgi:predicted TPR repeat methyltransferase
MSDQVFGQVYANQYDFLYSDKDYEGECDLLEEISRRYGDGSVCTILDLGCGTGIHAIRLARRGYEVTGVDRSAEMLAKAERKAAELGQRATCQRSLG